MSSAAKTAFTENVKMWVTLDNQLKKANSVSKQLRENKSEVEDTLLDYVVEHNMADATINISDGSLKFVTQQTTAPLTLKYVEECLVKCIRNESHVASIMNYIKVNRPVKEVADIKRFVKKSITWIILCMHDTLDFYFFF